MHSTKMTLSVLSLVVKDHSLKPDNFTSCQMQSADSPLELESSRLKNVSVQHYHSNCSNYSENNKLDLDLIPGPHTMAISL